ncbi:lysoplasmalogenase [Rathayibacter sp. YIM 133350]|uniref:lysoplasmalogenase n=1 Tax=Rathayibacter sp. YIM 133350 TaxID=3131992 RepID=UPI00307DFCC4
MTNHVQRSSRWRAFVPYALVGMAHVVLVLTGPEPAAAVSKALLMPALALGLFLSARSLRRAVVLSTLAALVLSWLGDVVLGLPWANSFVIGLAAFLLAHAAYLVLFLAVLRLRRPRLWAGVYVLWFVAFVAVLGPSLGALFVPVAVYGAVLGAMAAFASGGSRMLAAGGALFVASDSLLAFLTFWPGIRFPGVDALIMAGYILAQGLIIASVVRTSAASRQPDPDGDVAPAFEGAA